MVDLSDENTGYCRECGSDEVVRDPERAEITCRGCGLVLREKVADTGPEWRAFDKEERDKRSRAGAPVTFTIHDKGLSTVIDWRSRDSSGKGINPRTRVQIYRLRKWQSRIRVSDASERNLAYALSELERMSSNLFLPRNVRETAALVYRKAVENRLIRGRSIEGMVAAALYAACRQCAIPRTLDEVSDVSKVEKKEVARGYRFIATELEVKVPPTSPINYVPRLVSVLSLRGEVQGKAIEIIEEANRSGLTSGRGPTGVAAAAVYIASILMDARRTQREVAAAASVTEVTVRNRYKEFLSELTFEVVLSPPTILSPA
jgi:transcription initiation factor TFIIB